MAGKKILVADDSLTIQKVIRLALSGDGYEIQTVSDGKEAIEQASLFRPDICIIDVSLPHYDAYQIREHFIMKPDLKNIPVILMSSAFEKVDETRAETLGFAGHLIKPFDPSHLRSTLLSVANRAPENDPVEAMINDPIVPVHPQPQKIQFYPTFQDLPPLTAEHGGYGGQGNPSSGSPSFQTNFQQNPPASSFGNPSSFQQGNPPFQNTASHIPPFQSTSHKSTSHQNTPSGMDDIQEMARSTFEMSGLNQSEWGMIEPGKMSDPFEERAPATSLAHTRENEVTSFDLNEVPTTFGYDGASQPDKISVTAKELEAMVRSEVEKLLEQMNGQVHERVENDLKRYVQELMPALAERIIKEEIHKLLANPPM